MTTDTISQDTVALLSYDQLLAAFKTSNDEYERRFAAFLRFAEIAKEIITFGLTGRAEAKADLDSAWAGCKAQQAMTRAITAEISSRVRRGDYA